jgi:hypothetical protein
MEPSAYRTMRMFQREAPPFIPTESSSDPPSNTSSQPLSHHQSTEGARAPTNPDWTVYNMNIMRGPLGTEVNPHDPRNLVGWSAEAQKRNEVRRKDGSAAFMAGFYGMADPERQMPFMSDGWMEDES